MAEGVESVAQLEFLKQLKCCGGFQGYLFAKPLPPPKFASLLKQGCTSLRSDCGLAESDAP